MFGGSRMRSGTALAWSLVKGLCGWIFIAPIAASVPKRRDWVAVIGRQDGRLLDNVKYFFLQASQDAPDAHCTFVTTRAHEARRLRSRNMPVLQYPSWRAAIFLMRCGSVVVDEAAWYRQYRGFLLVRAKAIQLWHGVGCKWVESGLWAHETGDTQWASNRLLLILRAGAYRMTRRRIQYAAVVTTSEFYRERVFRPAFSAHKFPITGYPRNDFAQSLTGVSRELAWSNVDTNVKSKLDEWKQRKRRLVLVAPTFRDSGALPMQLDAATLQAIDTFADEHGVELLFKFHPSERNADAVSGRHFHVCARDSDVYPLLPYAAALVTDYSSISMDFLLVDKPLLFLIPEDDDYTTNDRQLQFDPRTMMPGPVVPDWRSLLPALLAEWTHDGHADERAALRRKAFDDLPQSEAVPRLLAFMREQGWIGPAPSAADSRGNQGETELR